MLTNCEQFVKKLKKVEMNTYLQKMELFSEENVYRIKKNCYTLS